MPSPVRIAFLYVSEPHQVFHSLGAALQLARMGYQVDALYASDASAEIIRARDEEGSLRLIPLAKLPASGHGILSAPPRLPTLLMNARLLARYDYLVATERTSTLLRRLPGFHGKLIHIPHGAGDRARGYDRRIRYFDLVLVAGEKDRRRYLEQGLASEADCVVAGYAKPELMAPPKRLFDRDNPVVLYNPHFDPALSSWIGRQDEMIAAFAAMPDLDFVMAPHIRMKRQHRIADPGLPNLMIDWGSIRSIDMTYSNSADIYLGDVSSQVYEFLSRPRPCVFLNRADIAWRDDPHYAHWYFGEVVTALDALPTALREAPARHPAYLAAQQRGEADSIDRSDVPASLRQAQAIARFIGDAVA